MKTNSRSYEGLKIADRGYFVRVFTSEDSFEYKINFVDDNDVFLGFDYSQSCCEWFGYLILKELPDFLDYEQVRGRRESLEPEIDIKDYYFDTSFFKKNKQL